MSYPLLPSSGRTVDADEAIKLITHDLAKTAVLSKAEAHDNHWRTSYWYPGRLSMDRNNHYFTSLSLADGSHKESDAGTTFALVFDDPVEFDDPTEGTPLQDLVAHRLEGPGEVSYVLQTSLSKYQAGLLLMDNDLTPPEINKLMELIQNMLPKGAVDKGRASRMARLPGINNKPEHVEANGGLPFQSRYTEWRPKNRFSVSALLDLVSMTYEELAEVATRSVSLLVMDADHPILKNEFLEVIGPHALGYEIECPWRLEHTAPDTPALLTINEDRVIGFKCMHAHCADRNGKVLLSHLESLKKGTTQEVIAYRKEMEGSRVLEIREQLATKTMDQLLKRYPPEEVLRARTVFVEEHNRFYNLRTGGFSTKDAFNQSNGNIDGQQPSNLLKGVLECNVNSLTCDFREPRIFTKDDVCYVNKFDPRWLMEGIDGDYGPFVRHVHRLYGDWADHILDYLAFTIQYPGIKINHMLILGGRKGIGKDAMLQPIVKHLGRYYRSVETPQLFSVFNSHLDGTKLLVINELFAPKKREREEIHNHLKNVIASPPETLNINQKGLRLYQVPNLVSTIATTNFRQPIPIEAESRRFFMAFSEVPATAENLSKARYLYTWYKNANGLAISIGYLQSRDVSGFDPNISPPMTGWLKETVESSKSSLELAINEAVGRQDVGGNYIYPPLMPATDIRKALKDWAGITGESQLRIPAANKLGVELAQMGFEQVKHNGKVKDVPTRLWVVRDHKTIEDMRLKDKLSLYHRVESIM